MDIDKLARYLEQRARMGKTVYYGEVARHFGVRKPLNPWKNNPLCQAFGKLDEEDAVKKRPFRTSMVIARKNDMPGQGFFTSLRDLKGITSTNKTRKTVFMQEKNAAIAYQW